MLLSVFAFRNSENMLIDFTDDPPAPEPAKPSGKNAMLLFMDHFRITKLVVHANRWKYELLDIEFFIRFLAFYSMFPFLFVF